MIEGGIEGMWYGKSQRKDRGRIEGRMGEIEITIDEGIKGWMGR
jgi:hypothetical protein